MPDSAIAAYVAAESLPAYTDFADIGVYESPVMFRLGELYEGKGDRAQAMEWYQRFIDRWRTADPVHQGRVTEARTRLARLKAATD
jgi:hypothetical protein